MTSQTEYLALAIEHNFHISTLLLKKLNHGALPYTDDNNFQLQREVEPDYQLMKSYIQGRTADRQILPIIRRKLPNVLTYLAKAAKGTPFGHDLEVLAQESLTITDESIIGALAIAKPGLTQLITELEAARTH